jgi:phosphate uptake regulator
MNRKVSLIGPATLMVSLPSKWCRDNNIKKGDDIEIEEDGGKIIISKNKSSKNSKKEVSIEQNNYHLIKYLLRIPYSEGCNEIKIMFKDPGCIETIRKVNQDHFIGFEIVEQTERYCILKNIAFPEDEGFSSLYYRLLNVTLDFKKTVYEYILNKKYDRTSEIKSFELMGDKINYWCRRSLNVQTGLYNEIDRKRIYKILGILEEICDEYRKLYDHVVLNNIVVVSAQSKEYFLKVNNLLEYMVSLLRNNERQTKHLIEFRNRYITLIDNETFKKIPPKERSLLIFLRGVVDLSIHVGCEEISYN